jgi:membrane protease YdiL (CAAX protease family)
LALALVIRLMMSLIALGFDMISTIQLRPGGPVQYVILAVVFFVFALPEELGWRGYALPKLLERHSPLVAGLIIGLLWGSLHLALLLPGMMNEGTPPLATLLGLVGGSVLFTWLYVNSGGSILLTALFHAAQSFFVIVNEGIALEQQAWLMTVVYWMLAFIIIIVAGSSFGRKPKEEISQIAKTTHKSQPLAQK